MRSHRIRNLPKIAKYAVLAMLLADGAGIYLAHHRINQVPALSLAAIEDADFAMAAPGLGDAAGGLQQSSSQVDASDRVAARPFEALPPMLAFKPIEPEIIDEVTPALRVAEAAARGTFVPGVRIAAIRPIRKHSRLFTTAFARDIDGPARAASNEPDVDFAQVRAAREAAQQSGAAYGESVPDVSLPSAETPTPELPAEPVAVQADAAGAPDVPVETAPSAPDASGGGELPAS